MTLQQNANSPASSTFVSLLHTVSKETDCTAAVCESQQARQYSATKPDLLHVEVSVMILISDVSACCMLLQSCLQNHQPSNHKLISLHPSTAAAVSAYRNTTQASLYDCQMLMQMGARVGKPGR